MKIGVLGGTFDPPHIGHMILADEAYQQLELSILLWVPVSTPPHKSGEIITDIHQRTNLVRLAIKDDPRFQLSRVDIDRPPPHYAVDTMRLLQNSYSDSDLIYLMGADSLNSLHKWHNPTKFVESCTALGIMHRSGSRIELEFIEERIPSIRGKIIFIKAPLIEFSASQIRTRIKNGLAFRYYLPKRVYKSIEANNLYK